MVSQQTALAFQATDMTLRAFYELLDDWKGTTMEHSLHKELRQTLLHTRLLVGNWWGRIHRSSQPMSLPKPLHILSSIG